MTVHLQKQLTLLYLAIISVFLLMKVWDRNKWVDSKERDQAYESRIERLNNAEQYALLALIDGWYICSHCPEGQYWLQANEVWKFGISTNPESRYTDEFLHENKVYYQTEFTGTLQECLEQEAQKIFMFYKHPQNLKRHESIRIARPPGNKRDD